MTKRAAALFLAWIPLIAVGLAAAVAGSFLREGMVGISQGVASVLGPAVLLASLLSLGGALFGVGSQQAPRSIRHLAPFLVPLPGAVLLLMIWVIFFRPWK